jgi:hypothetical protein
MAIDREAVTVEAVDLVARIVASILTDEPDPAWIRDVARLTEQQTAELLAAFAAHRILEIVSSSRYLGDFPPQIALALQAKTRMVAEKVLRLAHDTREVFSDLTDAGVTSLVIKGIPLSIVSTGKINARGPGDVDVLVATNDVARAHEVLIREGWNADWGITPGIGNSWKFFAWLSRELPYSRGNSHVDLHWRVSKETRLFPRAEELIARGQTVSIGGRDVLTLSPPDALTAAAYHFYHDGCGSLRGLIDVFRLSRVVATLPADCAPALRKLTLEVVEFSRTLFAPEGREASEVDVSFIQALWAENSRMVKGASPAGTLPFQEFTNSWRQQLATGNAVGSFFQFWLARILDFDGRDLRRGPWVVVEAFTAELKIQLSHVGRFRSRPSKR